MEVLLELRERRAAEDSDDAFFAERNAELVVDAEEYYREMFRSSRESWNLRDRHTRMAAQFDLLVHVEETTALEPLERSGEWQRGEAPRPTPGACDGPRDERVDREHPGAPS